MMDTQYEPKNAPLIAEAALNMIVAFDGLTADECATKLGQSVLNVRPAVCRLHKSGLVYDSGLRRKNLSGRKAAVWRA